MLTVIDCIIEQHDLRLVALAAVVCGLGAWVSLAFHARVCAERGWRAYGWLFATGVVAGGAIWCTHFVAMLGYLPGTQAELDPLLTGASFLIAVTGTALGFGVAARLNGWPARAAGGALVGAAVAAMHYVGMSAYRVEGVLSWRADLVAASIAIALVGGMVTLLRARGATATRRLAEATVWFVLTITGLHFTAMTAAEILPFEPAATPGLGADMAGLAVITGGVGLLIVGMAVTGILLERSLKEEAAWEISNAAQHDAMTGLANRGQFVTLAERRIAQAGQGAHFAAVLIDLHDFKLFNEEYGHDAGDRVLVALAERLVAAAEPDELLGRVGGDHFAAFRRTSCKEERIAFVERMHAAASGPLRFDGHEYAPQTCVGAAYLPKGAETAQGLLSAAELAARHASGEPGRVFHFDQSLTQAARRQMQIADELRTALAEGALTLHYQAQRRLSDGAVTGCEALARWHHPRLGNISPGEFAPVAERSGQVVALGEFALGRACADALDWPEGIRVAVNISPVHIARAELPPLVEEVLWRSGLPASRLEIEVTESALMEDTARAVRTLGEIQRMGVTVALDDFGVGYSSLAHLQAFPFDKIKLDRGFVRGLGERRESVAIVRAVVALGESLGVPVLAEGIETEEQRDLLAAEGCRAGQGFLFDRPCPLEELPFLQGAVRRAG